MKPVSVAHVPPGIACPGAILPDAVLPELTGSAHHWMRLSPRRRRRRPGPFAGHSAGSLAALAAASSARLARAGVIRAAALVFATFAVTEPVALQDVGTLLAGAPAGAPRWMARVVATGGGVDAAPSFAFADAGATGPALAALAGPAGTMTLAAWRPAAPPGELPPLRVERAGKDSRKITVAPATGEIELAAGTLLGAGSIVDDDMAQAALRVAFVKLPPVSSLRERSLIARETKAGDDPASVRARLQFAQAAAAASASVVSAYAAEGDVDIEAPFRALFADPAVATGLGEEEVTAEELAVDPHAWVGKPLPANVLLNSEQRCLAEAVYFEARGESYNGQVAVAQVVLNRVRNPAYPNTICKVVYQNRQKRNACQFSFACDLVPDRVVNDRHWKQAQEIARETTAGRLKIAEIEASTHYHATYVNPRWAKSMQKQKQIGLHIFYKTYGGGWS